MGKLLLERGHMAMLLSEETPGPGQESSQDRRRRAPPSPRPTTPMPRRSSRSRPHTRSLRVSSRKTTLGMAERDAIYATLLDAMLQKAVADYELAETFPAGSPERTKSLKDALDQFDIAVQESPRAMGRPGRPDVAGEVLRRAGRDRRGHRDLQGAAWATPSRSCASFSATWAISTSSRWASANSIALAADEASRWLATYNRREERRSPAGLGVLIELAKNIDAQMAEIAANERPKAIKQIVDAASQVVRFASPYKKDALALLKKYKPSAALRAEEIAQADLRRCRGPGGGSDRRPGLGASDRPVQGRPSARPTRPANIDKANLARYNLAFCYYMNKQFYEADVLAEHLARRYPREASRPRRPRSACSRWPMPTTPTPRSTA